MRRLVGFAKLPLLAVAPRFTPQRDALYVSLRHATTPPTAEEDDICNDLWSGDDSTFTTARPVEVAQPEVHIEAAPQRTVAQAAAKPSTVAPSMTIEGVLDMKSTRGRGRGRGAARGRGNTAIRREASEAPDAGRVSAKSMRIINSSNFWDDDALVTGGESTKTITTKSNRSKRAIKRDTPSVVHLQPILESSAPLRTIGDFSSMRSLAPQCEESNVAFVVQLLSSGFNESQTVDAAGLQQLTAFLTSLATSGCMVAHTVFCGVAVRALSTLRAQVSTALVVDNLSRMSPNSTPFATAFAALLFEIYERPHATSLKVSPRVIKGCLGAEGSQIQARREVFQWSQTIARDLVSRLEEGDEAILQQEPAVVLSLAVFLDLVFTIEDRIKSSLRSEYGPVEAVLASKDDRMEMFTGLQEVVESSTQKLLDGPEVQPSHVCAALRVCGVPHLTYPTSRIGNLHKNVNNRFSLACRQLSNDTVHFDAVMLSSEVLSTIRCLSAPATAHLHGGLCRELLSALSCVVGTLADDPQRKTTFVGNVISKLAKGGFPSDAVLSSQFCVGLSANELIDILTEKSCTPRDNIAVAVEKLPVSILPEILTKTLNASVAQRCATLRNECYELSAMQVREDPATAELLDDIQKLLAEYITRGMRKEVSPLLNQLISSLQALYKTCSDPHVVARAMICPMNAVLSRTMKCHEKREFASNCVELIGEVWTLLISKNLIDVISGIVAGATREATNPPLDADSNERTPLLQLLDELHPILAASLVFCQPSIALTQLVRHFAVLLSKANSSDVVSYLGAVAKKFLETATTFELTTNAAGQCTTAKRNLHELTDEVLRATSKSFVAKSAEWGEDWNNVHLTLNLLRIMTYGPLSVESESGVVLAFRTEVLDTILSSMLGGEREWAADELLAVAEVMYVPRSAHMVSTAFDDAFTEAFRTFMSNGKRTNEDLAVCATIVALACATLRKETHDAVKNWKRRILVFAQYSCADGGAPCVPFESCVEILNSISLNRSSSLPAIQADVETVVMPLVDAGVPTSSLRTAVDALTSLVALGIIDATATSLFERIRSDADALDFGDCGDVAGLVGTLANRLSADVLTLPTALHVRVMENKSSCNASQTSRIVKGFSMLKGNLLHDGMAEKVMTTYILRSIQVAPQMRPAELLATLEGFLRVQCSHMSLFGVLLAKIADSRDSFSLPQTVRLVTACNDAAKYDVRVHKACLTAAQPVFLAMVHHLLKNDVTSLVGTSNHAELILSCLSSAFPKEAIADEVLRAVAQHCKQVPLNGVLEALRLISKRESADFNAAKVLFQHCINDVLPVCTPCQLGATTLLLVKCGIRTHALFSTVDKRLAALSNDCDMATLSPLCEAALLGRRDDNDILCEVLCKTLGRDEELTLSMGPHDLRLALVVLAGSFAVVRKEHLPTIAKVITALSPQIMNLAVGVSNSSLPSAAVLYEWLVQVAVLVEKLFPFATTSSSADPGCVTDVMLRNIAVEIGNACHDLLRILVGGLTVSSSVAAVDIMKTVQLAHCLVRLAQPYNKAMTLLLRHINSERDSIRKRHVLKTMVDDILKMGSAADGAVQTLSLPDAEDVMEAIQSEDRRALDKLYSEIREWADEVNASEGCGRLQAAAIVDLALE